MAGNDYAQAGGVLLRAVASEAAVWSALDAWTLAGMDELDVETSLARWATGPA